MGGQACVVYGAAQVSRDIDFLLLATPENYAQLKAALSVLGARRIAVPRFEPELLARGHAVHFRCSAPEVEDLRVDVMTRLRNLPDFPALWERRNTFEDKDGTEFHLLSVPDLVQAKKTQRSKDWPIIESLVAIHYQENGTDPKPDWISFWLREARTAELLQQLVQRFHVESRNLVRERPLLSHASEGDLDVLRAALDAEVRAEQAKDRAYWEPLRRELEAFRREELQRPSGEST